MIGLMYCKTFWPMFGLMLLHCFFYVPTMSVTNAVAFAYLKDPKKDFGPIRVWGTLGWIAASWPFIFIPIDWAKVPTMADAGGFVSWLGTALGTLKTGDAMEAALTSTFLLAGIASFALAAFSLTLPRHSTVEKGALGLCTVAKRLKLLLLCPASWFSSLSRSWIRLFISAISSGQGPCSRRSACRQTGSPPR